MQKWKNFSDGILGDALTFFLQIPFTFSFQVRKLYDTLPYFKDLDVSSNIYDRLEKIAEWMKINGEAIYNSNPVKPYKEGKVCLTQLRDETTYAIYLAEEHEQTLPEELRFAKFCPSPKATIELLGTGGTTFQGQGEDKGRTSIPVEKITWRKKGTGCAIHLPLALSHKLPNHSAWTLRIR